MSVASDMDEETRILVAGHRDFLAFLTRRVGDREVAEDLLQESFAKALPKLPQLEKRESAVAWFYRILRNAVVEHARRRDRTGRAVAALAAELRAEVPEPGGEVERELCRCVGRLARSLKPEYRAAIEAVEVGGAELAGYAAGAGITRGNAAVRLHRARQALRKQVVAACGTCAEHGCRDCSCGEGEGHGG